MTKTGKIVSGIIVLILIVWGLTSISKQDSPETIKIGFVGPLSGDLANMGENAQAGVKIAVEEINSKG